MRRTHPILTEVVGVLALAAGSAYTARDGVRLIGWERVSGRSRDIPV